MSIARITELISESPDSFDDAVRKGIERANRTLKNVRGAWVEDQKVECDDSGAIKVFRVALKVTFVLDD
ncbi:MAG: dodecin family protein [Wenzhouxiangellaceae bacterium]|nr:dodecin family protein [Wenzhouxiangellaceae bacterium]